MKYGVLASLIVSLLVASSSARGALIITTPDIQVSEGSGFVDVVVTISGDDVITDASLVLFVGGGGPTLGFPDAPDVIDGMIDGGVLDNSPASGYIVSSFSALTDEVGSYELSYVNAVDAQSPDNASTNILVTWTLDITGFSEGQSFALEMGSAEQMSLIAGASVSFIEGTITIVPEPTNLAMVGIAGLLVGWRRGTKRNTSRFA